MYLTKWLTWWQEREAAALMQQQLVLQLLRVLRRKAAAAAILHSARAGARKAGHQRRGSCLRNSKGAAAHCLQSQNSHALRTLSDTLMCCSSCHKDDMLGWQEKDSLHHAYQACISWNSSSRDDGGNYGYNPCFEQSVPTSSTTKSRLDEQHAPGNRSAARAAAVVKKLLR